EGADLSMCDLRAANMKGAVLVNAALSLADLTDANLAGALTNKPMGPTIKDFKEPLDVLLRHHTHWVGSNTREGKQLDISGFDLRGVNFGRACLTMVKGHNVMLYGVNFADAQMQAVDLRDADMRHTNLQSADMRGGDFTCVKLNNANLQGAQLQPLT